MDCPATIGIVMTCDVVKRFTFISLILANGTLGIAPVEELRSMKLTVDRMTWEVFWQGEQS